MENLMSDTDLLNFWIYYTENHESLYKVYKRTIPQAEATIKYFLMKDTIEYTLEEKVLISLKYT